MCLIEQSRASKFMRGEGVGASEATVEVRPRWSGAEAEVEVRPRWSEAEAEVEARPSWSEAEVEETPRPRLKSEAELEARSKCEAEED